MSVARLAVRQPLLHAYSAIAEPSSCATLPNVNASRPFAPKRFGPIWSVPMHGATASTPRLIASWTTGAARSTSHVVKMMFAPCPSSFAAHAFAIAGLLPCVSHVVIWSGRPLDAALRVHLLRRAAAPRRAPGRRTAPSRPCCRTPSRSRSAWCWAAGADAAVIATTAVSVASAAAIAPVFLLVITPPGALDWFEQASSRPRFLSRLDEAVQRRVQRHRNAVPLRLADE